MSSSLSVIQFLGNKRKVLPLIVDAVKGCHAVVDLFSGSATVGSALKLAGKRVLSVDLLAFCYHLSRAIVENPSTKLSAPTVWEALQKVGSEHPLFFSDLYAGKVFLEADCLFLDRLRAAADLLGDYEKSICIAAAASAMVAKSSWGRFNVGIHNHLTPAKMPKHLNRSLQSYFEAALNKMNSAVRAATVECRSLCACACAGTLRPPTYKAKRSLWDEVVAFGADAVYLDPPYPTFRRQTSYEYFYHVVETWSAYDPSWKIQDHGLIQKEVTSPFTGKASDFFEAFKRTFDGLEKTPLWVLSYASHCKPSIEELTGHLESLGREVTLKTWGGSFNKSKWSKYDQPSECLILARK